MARHRERERSCGDDGLPREAFAVVAGEAREMWAMPHHRPSVRRALAGGGSLERSVDWRLVEAAVEGLSVANRRRHLGISPGDVLDGARHLAAHYRRAGRHLPDALAALI